MQKSCLTKRTQELIQSDPHQATNRAFCACLDLSVSSSSWGLGRAAVCDCGTALTFLLPFFLHIRLTLYSWVSQFRKSRTDKVRPERSAKTVTPTLVGISEVFVDKKSQSDMQEVTNQLSSGKASVPQIFHDKPAMGKINARWVPK